MEFIARESGKVAGSSPLIRRQYLAGDGKSAENADYKNFNAMEKLLVGKCDEYGILWQGQKFSEACPKTLRWYAGVHLMANGCIVFQPRKAVAK